MLPRNRSTIGLLLLLVLTAGCESSSKNACPSGQEICRGRCVPYGTCEPTRECQEPEQLADTQDPDHVVGDGSPASCTEDELRSAVEAGGIVTFDCGPDPFTFRLTETLIPGRTYCEWSGGDCARTDTVIDGGGLITLDGQNAVRPVTFDTADHDDVVLTLRVQRLAFINGSSASHGSLSEQCGVSTDGGGGAIYLFGGNLIVIECEFYDNHGAPAGPDVAGGAIYSRGLGRTTVIRSILEGNSCATGGGIGALASSLVIVNTSITSNQAVGDGCGGNGGGIYQDGSAGSTLSICGATVSDNTCISFGGALFRTAYDTSQTTVIDRSTFVGNANTGFDNAGAGAIYLQGTPVTLTNSTIAENDSAYIGGIWVLSHGDAPGVLNMTNVTVTGNMNRGWGGSAVKLGGNTGATWQNVTVAGNVGENVDLAIELDGESDLTVTNSILEQCTRTVTGDHNLQWPKGGEQCTFDVVFADPMLGSLQDNGGPTQTMAPSGQSPAAGAGAGCAPTDQRGIERAEACTLGAYEVE